MYKNNIPGFNFISFALFCFHLLSCDGAADKQPSDEKPNIVFILADDLGYGDLGCYNADSKIPTPNLDHLASQGMKFLDAHAPAAVCTPTRYGILTGRYCWRSRLPVGVLRGYGRALIEPQRKTVANLLKEAGYHTGVIGKWHLGLDWVVKEEFRDSISGQIAQINEVGMVTEMNPDYIDFNQAPTDGPLNHGFNYSYILPASLDMDPYCYLENDRLVQLPTALTPGNDLNTGYTGAFWRAGKIAEGFEFDQVLPTFTQKAKQFIQETSEKDNPFFLYLPFPSPHTPWVPTSEYRNKTKVGAYGDFTTMVDAMVGRILQTLDSLNYSENTLVIFTSDNGPFWTPALIEQFQHRAAGNLRGMKADAYEGGHRVPFIARWPDKIKAGSTSRAMISLTSLLATCADILNVEVSDDFGEDSQSIWPVLSGATQEVPGQEAIIQHSSKNFFAVRKGDWKLITGIGSGGFSEPSVVISEDETTGQLYNLNDDPGELTNLFLKMPEKVLELKEILERYKLQGHSH
ncbi:MAG: arylsulfatase [Saprospiraceae bacterium]|nr:arylsulfatase [Saprospiraceae bacterium]